MDILISGASTGIGKATAIDLAGHGHTVWAGVRSQSSFDELSRLNVRGLQPIILDVCSEKSIIAAVGRIQKESGLLHALINNAGIGVGGPIEAVPLNKWREQFETNVFGVVRLTQECLPLLRQSKGRIVNISSIAGRVASPFLGPYAASKFALEALSDSLRRELKPFGIKVSLIEPGPIKTPIWKKSLASSQLSQGKEFDPEILAIYEQPLKKFSAEIEKAAQNAAPVELVVNVIRHAISSPKPRLRYPVGPGIAAAWWLTRFMPDKWTDRLMSKRV